MQKNGKQHVQPDLLKATWAPVYLEPIHHSGERITIANALVTDDNEIVKVISTLHPGVLRCLFGKKQTEVLDLADIIIKDISKHLNSGYSIQDWAPVLPGVFLGKVRKIKDYSIKAMLAKTIASTSSLGVTEATEAEHPKKDKITSQVSARLKSKYPGLAKNLNRHLEHNGRRIATISYIDQNLAANFAAIKPQVQNQRNALDAVIRSFTDINSLIKRRDLYDAPTWSGVIIQQPNRNLLTLKQEETLSNQMIKIETLSEDLSIPTRFVLDADEIVEMIVSTSK